MPAVFKGGRPRKALPPADDQPTAQQVRAKWLILALPHGAAVPARVLVVGERGPTLAESAWPLLLGQWRSLWLGDRAHAKALTTQLSRRKPGYLFVAAPAEPLVEQVRLMEREVPS
jgi:hypothetical protein